MLITKVQVSKLYDDLFEKTHFGLKNQFSLYLEGQTQHTLRFSGVPITMEQVSKLRFLVKTLGKVASPNGKILF